MSHQRHPGNATTLRDARNRHLIVHQSLALLPVGFKAYRTNGLLLVLIAVGVSAGLYAFQIIPTAMATGGPERFVP